MSDALAFVDRCARALAPARALDVACGRGRHLALLAGLGWHVTGVDLDEQALGEAAAQAPTARLLTRDVEAEGLPPEWSASFDLVVVTFFLHRPLFADLARVLAPSGRLVLETFHDENRRLHGRPRRPHLALGPGEGRALCEGVGLLVLENDEADRGDIFTTRVLAARPALPASKPRLGPPSPVVNEKANHHPGGPALGHAEGLSPPRGLSRCNPEAGSACALGTSAYTGQSTKPTRDSRRTRRVERGANEESDR